MRRGDLDESEFDPYYGRYISKNDKNITLIEGLELGFGSIINFFRSIPVKKFNYRYLPEKWSVKEIFQHLIDTERVFIYRCFRIARGDKTSLPGFDQNIFIEPSGANQKSLEILLEEFNSTRKSSISLINSLSDENLKSIGNANGGPMSARAAAFIITGHEIWHMEIIKEMYL